MSSAEAHESQPAAPDDTAPHLLIVDDDRRIRDLLARYLRDNGFRVSVSADAAEARAALRGLAFDLIILDVMMPGESGLSLAQTLRAESDVPILMLTARSEPEHRVDGLELGVDDYMAKPFDPGNCCCACRTSCDGAKRRSRRPRKCVSESVYSSLRAAN